MCTILQATFSQHPENFRNSKRCEPPSLPSFSRASLPHLPSHENPQTLPFLCPSHDPTPHQRLLRGNTLTGAKFQYLMFSLLSRQRELTLHSPGTLYTFALARKRCCYGPKSAGSEAASLPSPFQWRMAVTKPSAEERGRRAIALGRLTDLSLQRKRS